MFEMISIVVVTLRQQRTIQTLASIERFLPSLAVSNDASPRGWSQIGHTFSRTLQIIRESALRKLSGACLGRRGSLVRIQSPRPIRSAVVEGAWQSTAGRFRHT